MPSLSDEPQSSPANTEMTEVLPSDAGARIEPLNTLPSSQSSSVDSSSTKYQAYRPPELSVDDSTETSTPPAFYSYSPSTPYAPYYGPGMPAAPGAAFYYSPRSASTSAEASSYSPTSSSAGFWSPADGQPSAYPEFSPASSYSPRYCTPEVVYPYPYYPPVYYPAQYYATDAASARYIRGSPSYEYGSYEHKAQAKIRRRKDPAAPKNPKSAYLYFLTEQRALISQDEDNRDFTDFAKELGAKWRNLSEEEKAPYFELAKKDKERYLAEKAQYGNRKVFVPTAE